MCSLCDLFAVTGCLLGLDCLVGLGLDFVVFTDLFHYLFAVVVFTSYFALCLLRDFSVCVVSDV